MLKTHTPSKDLQPYVTFIYHIKWERKDYKDVISEFGLPSGHSIIGFHFKGQCSIVLENEVQKLPKFYVVGQQMQKHYKKSTSDSLELYAAIFRPTGLWHVFGLDMSSITDKAIAADVIFGDGIRNFKKKFEARQSPENRIQLINELLLKKCLSIQSFPNFIDYAIQLMNETYGCSSITKIVSQLNVSERYFEKQFKLMVGITPCAYNRIVRFNYMFAQMKLDTPIDYQSLCVLFNYYDLPHFSKDFKKYCGSCPSKFYVNKFKFLRELMIEKASFVKFA